MNVWIKQHVQHVEEGVIGLGTGDLYLGLSAFNVWSHDLVAVQTHAHKHATVTVLLQKLFDATFRIWKRELIPLCKLGIAQTNQKTIFKEVRFPSLLNSQFPLL